MPRVISEHLVEVTVATLASAIDVGDGGTTEQRLVRQAMIDGYFERSDLRVGELAHLDAHDAAEQIVNEDVRHRVRQFLVLLEFCRHPLDDAQATLTEHYAEALGGHGPGLDLARALVNEGAKRALLDYRRISAWAKPEWSEQSMLHGYAHLEEPDHGLAELLESFHELGEDTLGYQYVDFYRRNNMVLPGDDPSQTAFFFSHDMNHVMAGYEPTAIDEISLSAFWRAAADTDANWILLLTSIAAYEAGFLTSSEFEGKASVLAREGAAETFAEALRRGAKCSVDFAHLDPLALALRPLEELRREFGIEPRRC